MAAPIRRTDPSVAEYLRACPWDFEFFQAVRLLGLLHPEQRLLSRYGQPPGEVVRFHAHLSILFPPSAIQALADDAREGGPVHMTVNFLGLTGPMGVLPTHYTEYLLTRSSIGDKAAIAFFDLFNHRLITLFYFAWEKHHFPIGFERESISHSKEHRFTQYLFDLIGMGTPGLLGRAGIRDSVLLSYAGLLAQRPRSAVALASILRDYFQLPFEIEQFVGKWLILGQDSLSYLDSQGDRGQLGTGAIAGGKVWNQQARFRIRVGPLTWGRFNLFLPGAPAFRELVALARYFVNQAMEFDVMLILAAGEVRPCAMSSGEPAPRLGLSSWLKTVAFQDDAKDTVIPVRPSGTFSPEVQ